MGNFIDQSIFVLRFRFLNKYISWIRTRYFRLCGMKIGSGTVIPKIYVTWPHKVKIGNDCNLEHNIYFKFDGIWSPSPSIIIGFFTLQKVFLLTLL